MGIISQNLLIKMKSKLNITVTDYSLMGNKSNYILFWFHKVFLKLFKKIFLIVV